MPKTKAEEYIEPIADRSGIAKTVARLREIASERGLAEDQIANACLCLEEALTNVVFHGVAHTAAPVLAVSFSITDDKIRVQIEDNGIAFDPTTYAPKEAAADLATASLGGFGIHLIRQYADTLAYCRVSGRNRLTLTCDLTKRDIRTL